MRVTPGGSHTPSDQGSSFNTGNSQAIKKILAKAITHDEQQQYKLALVSYLQCLEQISVFVQADLNSKSTSSVMLSEQSQQLLKYSEQCMDRVTSLSGLTIQNSLTTTQHTSPASNPSTPSKPPTVKTAPSSNRMVPQPNGESQKKIMSPNDPSATHNTSTPTVSTNNIKKDIPNATTVNNTSNTGGASNITPVTQSPVTGNSLKTLQMKRKEYERNQMIQLKQIQTRQYQERSRQIELENNVNRFLERIQNKKRTFRWKEQDTWSKFIDGNFNYQDMDPVLIEKDRIFLDNLSRPSLLQPIGTVTSVPVSALSTFDDSGSSEPLNPTIEFDIRQHCKEILANPSHTLNQILVKFTEYFNEAFNSNRLVTIYESESDQKKLISKCVNDIEMFVDKLSMVLFGKYWEMTSQQHEEVVIDSIMEVLWGNGIFSKLLFWFIVVYGEQNNKMNEKITKCTQTISLHALRVSNKFLLDKDTQPFERTIALFREADHVFSIKKKIAAICKSIDQVSKDVNDYYIRHAIYNSGPLLVGADDLLPIFIYVIAKANVRDLYAKFQMMSDLIPEELIKGEGGYALATLETAMNCLTSFGEEEIQEISTIDQIRNELQSFESKLGDLDDISSVCSQEVEYEQEVSTPTIQPNRTVISNQRSFQPTTYAEDLDMDGELDLDDI